MYSDHCPLSVNLRVNLGSKFCADHHKNKDRNLSRENKKCHIEKLPKWNNRVAERITKAFSSQIF